MCTTTISRWLERSCCCYRGEKIDTFSYAFEGEMISLLHNKSGFPEGVSSYANVQRQFFESFVGQTFKVAYPPINFLLFFSVADPGCLSRIQDPGCLSRIQDPGFYPSRIPDLGSRISDPGSRIRDPKTATKERGEKKLVVRPFFVATISKN
jgi:hypothetical protein